MKHNESLSCAAVDVKPIDYDWSDSTAHPYGEAWQFYEALACEKCQQTFVGEADGGSHRDIDPSACCDGHVPQAEGPMMSYYYPLPNFDLSIEEAAKLIAHLSLCIVEFIAEETYALALTGGGMDLSWEICEAYMLLGYLPPLHFAELPAISRRGVSDNDRRIARACLESCRVAAGWATQKARGIKTMLAQAKKDTDKRRSA